LIGVSEDEIEGSVDDDEVYKSRAELVLISFSDSYSKLNSILVGVSSTFLIHLTLSTNYLNNLLLS